MQMGKKEGDFIITSVDNNEMRAMYNMDTKVAKFTDKNVLLMYEIPIDLEHKLPG